MELERIDTKVLYKNIKEFTILAVLSALLGVLIDGVGLFTIPVILGLYLAFSNLDRLRIKYFSFFMMPFLFLIIFFTGGGLLAIFNTNNLGLNPKLEMVFVGLWCSQIILLLVVFFIRVRLYYYNLPIIGFLILPPYLLGLHPTRESDNSIFLFYLLWQVGIGIGLSLSLLLSQKLQTKIIE